MYKLYRFLTRHSTYALKSLLNRRIRQGKEDPLRVNEKMGNPSRPRPDGFLFWIHAVSVGEAQSALILIEKLLERDQNAHILVTTGTRTSAQMMAEKLPERSFHQFYPLDHPLWVEAFLKHWSPDMVLWMESELWPNMLHDIHKAGIPALLVNARLSASSFRLWRSLRPWTRKILGTFKTILCQTPQDAEYFKALGAQSVKVIDNLKYSARPLPVPVDDFNTLSSATTGRPLWLYASTHEGEEALAASVHAALKEIFPTILTLIVPRHPVRTPEILKNLSESGLKITCRLPDDKKCPAPEDDIYLVSTLGELGLFYALSPIACIGRSFSADGGGGHNPIEAAQLGCIVLHGPNIQNLQDIFDAMGTEGAALRLDDEKALTDTLQRLLQNPEHRAPLKMASIAFAQSRTRGAEVVLDEIITLRNRVAS